MCFSIFFFLLVVVIDWFDCISNASTWKTRDRFRWRYLLWHCNTHKKTERQTELLFTDSYRCRRNHQSKQLTTLTLANSHLFNSFLADTLCQYMVPILMGMCRAVGRSSDEEMPLISYLLSVHRDSRVEAPENQESQLVQQRKSFNAFRPILPRTMSTLVLNQTDLPSPTSHSLLNPPDFTTRECSTLPLETQGHGGKEGAVDEQGDPADLQFNKVCVFVCVWCWRRRLVFFVHAQHSLQTVSNQCTFWTHVGVVGLVKVNRNRMCGIVWGMRETGW